jgi:protein SCO1/2
VSKRSAIFAALLSSSCTLASCASEEPIPELLPLGEFELVDQRGRAFGTDQLAGKVWIADFIFTSCPDVCPVLSSQMANLHRRIDRSDVHFVSITVDPEHDTPERLREYGRRYGASERWHFVTGEPETVRRTVIDRFRMAVGDREERGAGGYDILHAMRFVLVDRAGTIRGFYENDREGLERLERDASRLAEDG